ncbi:MAG: response regulator [Myxococcota bacterium]
MKGPRGARVLVVDDNVDDIELLRLSFARVGPSCSVVGTTSTKEALGLLATRDGRPDVVLLDWKMPSMDSPEFIRALRADPRTIGLAVLVFSSSDDPGDIRAAYAAGATAYLLKPPGLVEYESLARDISTFWCRPVRYLG